MAGRATELWGEALDELRSAKRKLLAADELNRGELFSATLHNTMFFLETALGVAEPNDTKALREQGGEGQRRD